MATIRLQNGQVVWKNGKASCECCCLCGPLNFESSSTLPPSPTKRPISGPGLVIITASDIDGRSEGWSMVVSGEFEKHSGVDFSFPTTTVSIPPCLFGPCTEEITIDEKQVSIPDGVCGNITYTFTLNGSDCCDRFYFQQSCPQTQSGNGIGLSLL